MPPLNCDTALDQGVAEYIVEFTPQLFPLLRTALRRLGNLRAANPTLGVARLLFRSQQGLGRALLVVEILGQALIRRGYVVFKDRYARPAATGLAIP